MKGKANSVWVAVLGGLLSMMFWLSVVGAPTDAPRIADVSKMKTESLWDFLNRFAESFEAQIFYALFMSGLIGALASYTWKWSKGEANGSHWTVRYIVGQVLWLAGISVAAIMTVGFQTESGEFYGWLSVIWAGGFAGFSGEVKIEMPDRKKIWTNDERAAASKDGDAKG